MRFIAEVSVVVLVVVAIAYVTLLVLERVGVERAPVDDTGDFFGSPAAVPAARGKL